MHEWFRRRRARRIRRTLRSLPSELRAVAIALLRRG